ncbi:MAG: hypothetical protein HUJ70_12795 [Pseudobutyrivibrio sp.]|nr:hypothetical protein [Pseudobutyrivibrio sp.]
MKNVADLTEIDLNCIAKKVEMLPQGKKNFANLLFEEISFTKKTLEGLKNDIAENGVTLVYEGSTGTTLTKTNPSVQTYNATLKSYNSTIRHLLDVIDGELEDEEQSAEAKLLKFLDNGK